MAKVKAVETRVKAAVGRERRLALAIVGLIDAYGLANDDLDKVDVIEETETTAQELLNELGYNGIEGTASRLKRLTAELDAAMAAGEYAKVAELGKELDKAKSGRFHKAKSE